MKDAKGHGSNTRGITKVTAIRYSNEPGSSRRTVSVTHNLGATSGYEDNLHMGALVTRGLREGATVSGGEPASGHQIDAAVASLHSGTAKSDAAPVHDSMSAKRLSDATGAMGRLRDTFHTGNNRFGEYGKNVKEAFDRHASVVHELTGKRPNIYDK